MAPGAIPLRPRRRARFSRWDQPSLGFPCRQARACGAGANRKGHHRDPAALCGQGHAVVPAGVCVLGVGLHVWVWMWACVGMCGGWLFLCANVGGWIGRAYGVWVYVHVCARRSGKGKLGLWVWDWASAVILFRSTTQTNCSHVPASSRKKGGSGACKGWYGAKKVIAL